MNLGLKYWVSQSKTFYAGFYAFVDVCGEEMYARDFRFFLESSLGKIRLSRAG